MEIKENIIADEKVVILLEEHLADMHKVTQPGSVHALNLKEFEDLRITFWTAWMKDQLLGCIALKELTPRQAEVKSMRTSVMARNQGVASELLSHLIQIAKERGYSKLNLETGSIAFFRPARKLYEKFGFVYCEPFGDYKLDPNSKFMELNLKK